MLDPRFSSASVLLYDPQSSLRHNTRVALLSLGFGTVEAVNDWAEFLERAEKGNFDLVVGDLISREGSLQTIVRQMRQQEIGKNPFINIILTLWDTSREHVYEGIQAGADDILSRPMSTNQLADRVHGLVNARKPFIVTEDYVGPERRQIVRGLSQGSLMIVPNSLKAKVENKPELDASPENIELAMTAIKDRRVSIFTEQFLRLSSKTVSMGAALKELDDRQALIEKMISMNEELLRLIQGTEYIHVETLCSAFHDVLGRVYKSAKELTEQDKELMFQIPFAIHTACKEVRKSASLAFDIEEVSTKLRRSAT
ncbi:response regulator [Sneathiella glossodoripedis]|uniref:response regulator n=1 Tax=Sneathiella glossodoripedis TaxID=418853 RepID=UPI00046E8802|nr:response regulator [Sneathiella glossodoripedis]